MMAKNTPARNMTAHVAAVAPARHRAVVVRILWMVGMDITKRGKDFSVFARISGEDNQ